MQFCVAEELINSAIDVVLLSTLSLQPKKHVTESAMHTFRRKDVAISCTLSHSFGH